MSGPQGEASPASTRDGTLNYQPQLDGLRALAVMGVVGWHLFGSPLAGGQLGVDLFFVLSGFLITLLLHEERAQSGTMSIRNFYARRVLRLLPALLLVLAVVAVAFGLRSTAPYRDATLWPGIPATLFYAASWLIAAGQSLGALSHVWSISVEEHFYAIWPLALVAIWRMRLEQWIPVAVMFAIAAGWRVYGSLQGMEGPILSYRPDMRAHQILVGAVAALLVANGFVTRVRGGLAWACAIGATLIVAAYPLLESRWPDAGITPVLLGPLFAVVVTYAWSSPEAALSRFLSMRTFTWLGRRSYVIYLVHLPMILFLVRFEDPPLLQLRSSLLAFVMTLLFAGLSYRFVEQPFLRLRHRFRRVARAWRPKYLRPKVSG